MTVAIGNLIDSPAAAAALPFMRPDGSRATAAEIAAEWNLVKNHPTAAHDGHRVLERVTRLRLTPGDVELVVLRKLAEMDRELFARFPAFPTWPADAQLGTLSLAWACGPAFDFPRCAAAMRARDWLVAERECGIDTTDNPGVVPRNAADRVLFHNAACVEIGGSDPEVLHWPRALTDDTPTVPVLPDPPSSDPPVVDWEIVHALPDTTGQTEDE